MSLIATVTDGVIQQTTASSTSLSAEKTSSTNTVNKEDFLQLLVAQMKYQDPLEPTSNTEYVSQYATFSELEQMQNMNSNVSIQRASALVGENVYMKVTNATTGNTDYVYGKVDYVQVENNKAYLSIKGSLYSIDDLDSIVDPDYMEAYEMAQDLVSRLAKLPTVANTTLSNKTEITELNTIYSDMTDYQKEFIASDALTLLQSYVSKIKELEAAQEEKA
ncbi:MAG: flagellar hook capping FlgD N-terminal domain-containing protein [Lachnospiraceae bacterium]|nr:flagellar hook capping FlgD N-terminal domain-containing protein [Lachnospiraceae bacterium]MDD3659375.1 flagellar hook capping FlgD N-terminal domain-containing protein [Lachnospiraceae bacterium]